MRSSLWLGGGGGGGGFWFLVLCLRSLWFLVSWSVGLVASGFWCGYVSFWFLGRFPVPPQEENFHAPSQTGRAGCHGSARVHARASACTRRSKGNVLSM